LVSFLLIGTEKAEGMVVVEELDAMAIEVLRWCWM
jgi:hypothetical protein